MTPGRRRGSEWRKIFLESLDSVLLVFGEKARDAIYRFLRDEYDLNRDDLAAEPQKLRQGLRALFGSSASSLERFILCRASLKAGLSSVAEDFEAGRQLAEKVVARIDAG